MKVLNPYFNSTNETLNPYFNYNGENYDNTNEQKLVQSLLREHIEQFGIKLTYIIREKNEETFDEIFGEQVATQFKHTFEIDGMMESPEGMVGRDSIQAFGYAMTDTIKIEVSFDKICEKIKALNIKGRTYPLVGDLIYGHMFGNMMEVKYVEDKSPSFVAGKWQLYTLYCQIYNHGSDTFNTGIEEIDGINEFDKYYSKPYSDNPVIESESDTFLVEEPNIWKDLLKK